MPAMFKSNFDYQLVRGMCAGACAGEPLDLSRYFLVIPDAIGAGDSKIGRAHV